MSLNHFTNHCTYISAMVGKMIEWLENMHGITTKIQYMYHTNAQNSILLESTERIPSWQANTSSASQEISLISGNPKVHYRIHKTSPHFPNLSQIKPGHVSPSHCSRIIFNIILPSPPRSSKWSLSLRYPHQNPVCIFPVSHTSHISLPFHSSWSDHPKRGSLFDLTAIAGHFLSACYYTTRPAQLTAKTRGVVAAESDTRQPSNKMMTLPNFGNYLPVTTTQHPTTTLLPEHQLSQSHWSYTVCLFHPTNIVYHFPPTSPRAWAVGRVCYVNKTSRQEVMNDIYQIKLRCYTTQREVTRIPKDQHPPLHNCENIKNLQGNCSILSKLHARHPVVANWQYKY